MASVYSQVVGLMDKVLSGVQANIYGYAQMVWNNALSQVLLAVCACVYVYLKIAGGNEWSRNDFKQIGIWLIIYVFLTAIFADYNNYLGFIGVVELPIEYLYQGIKNGGGTTLNLDKGIDGAIAFIGQLFDGFKFETENIGSFIIKMIIGVLASFVLFIFVIFLMIFTILIKFMSSLILGLCPLFIPCLIIKQFRGYFFSWLKLYAGIALQAPFVFLVGGVIFNGALSFTNHDTNMDASATETCMAMITPIVVTLIGIAALAKIPTWTQQIIGSGDGSHSTGLTAMAQTAGAMGSKALGKTMEGKAKGASLGRAALAGIASMIPVGGEHLANKILGGGNKPNPQPDNKDDKKSDDGKMEAKATPHQPKPKK
ncbi:hypothetical protein XJ32_09340 [Helicobacter bilis]|uniref:Type IV secretion system protein n=1 Tax=Helicobacter bilis TaxID=37372 RepID=A0A1Q2LJR4_9HELI|nr:type IV secretion system protein [Helicobacter bilis]AQQ60257.1 hypothetical protein XJ32_09340 [Helicobacter bilis]